MKNSDDNSEDSVYRPDIELILFNRPNAVSLFSQEVSAVASKIIFISHLDLEGSRSLIADEKLDILLYMALPTEKFTTLLSLARLAPIQVRTRTYARGF